MKDIVCQVCGAEKRVQNSNVGKYCSVACKSAAARTQAVCLGCGLQMSVLASQRPGKYCSNECRLAHKRQARMMVCETCGMDFEAFVSARRQYCSQRCRPPTNYRDGRAAHPHYDRWYQMVARCTKPHHREWRNYGGRGIAVCDEWFNPHAFYRYLDEVLGPCPETYSIDRIDNNGNYEPGNVRWASKVEQVANSRRH